MVGDISKQARERLEKELFPKGNIDIFDTNWLIDCFTEFYPQVFFHGVTSDFICDKIKELELNHSLKKLGKCLSEDFIDLKIASINLPLLILY